MFLVKAFFFFPPINTVQQQRNGIQIQKHILVKALGKGATQTTKMYVSKSMPFGNGQIWWKSNWYITKNF